MPKTFGYHPLPREKLTERRNYAEQMFQTAISTSDLSGKRAAPLLSVQNGDAKSFRKALPPRGIHDEIRRRLSGTFGEEEFFGGGLTIAPPSRNAGTGRACARSLDLPQSGCLARHRQTLPADVLGGDWRAGLAEVVDLPRDVEGWHAALCWNWATETATLGIEKASPKSDTCQPDVTWARKSCPMASWPEGGCL
jgi:penicillin-binding protein 1A